MDALTVQTTPAVIDHNFEELRGQLAQELERYDVVVTADTVKDAKARATELNKLAGEIDTRRKAAVKEVSAPIRDFETKAKELTGMCQDVRRRILDQVGTFEQETLAEVARLLVEKRDTLYAEKGIREEFRTASVEGLEKLSWLTTTGNLTAAASRAVEELVGRCEVLQSRTDQRLASLEAESYKAGLHSPLTREHVEGFLFCEEGMFGQHLQALIQRELDRQQETERRTREAAEREAAARAAAEERRRQEEAAETERQRQAEEASAEDESEPAPLPKPAADEETPAPAEPAAREPAEGGRRAALDLVLEVDVPAGYELYHIKAALIGRLQEAGINDSIRECSARWIETQPAEAAA